MSKEVYHPNAYLSKIKNIQRGLKARTRILNVLEKHSLEAKNIAEEGDISYSVAMHHLRLLEAEELVNRKGSRPCLWVLTGLGQRRLVDLG